MSEHHSAGGPTLPIVILDQHLPILILDQQTHEFIRDAGGLQLTVIIHAEGHSDPTPLALVCSLVQPFPTNCDATNTQWVLRFEPLQHPPQIHAHTEVYVGAEGQCFVSPWCILELDPHGLAGRFYIHSDRPQALIEEFARLSLE